MSNAWPVTAKQNTRDYSPEEREAIAKAPETLGISVTEVVQHYGISNPTMSNWRKGAGVGRAKRGNAMPKAQYQAKQARTVDKEPENVTDVKALISKLEIEILEAEANYNQLKEENEARIEELREMGRSMLQDLIGMFEPEKPKAKTRPKNASDAS